MFIIVTETEVQKLLGRDFLAYRVFIFTTMFSIVLNIRANFSVGRYPHDINGWPNWVEIFIAGYGETRVN